MSEWSEIWKGVIIYNTQEWNNSSFITVNDISQIHDTLILKTNMQIAIKLHSTCISDAYKFMAIYFSVCIFA